MGSGVLLAALVVLWFVVLVPMVVTRGDARADGRPEAAAGSGRTLKRRRPVDPVVHAETERVAIDRAALRTSGELKRDVHALRRRVLAGLVTLALVALVGAVAWRSVLWVPQVALDLAVVGYLVTTSAAAKRERRAAARRQVRDALRAPVRASAERPAERPAPRTGVRTDARTEATVAARVPEQLGASAASSAHPSVPLADVRPLRPGRVVAARTPTPAGWQNSAVVGLDDDDIGFAEIDVYQPRRVANG
ncbi:hypothetical protein [Modestobacter sp. NPDC049651]|uniref:hypothetical protein n=1 Tax=unclassified Modestobacter TaxID=2643866 RepID=UPI0033C8785D